MAERGQEAATSRHSNHRPDRASGWIISDMPVIGQARDTIPVAGHRPLPVQRHGDCAAKTGRALSEFRLDGAPSNLSFLRPARRNGRPTDLTWHSSSAKRQPWSRPQPPCRARILVRTAMKERRPPLRVPRSTKRTPSQSSITAARRAARTRLALLQRRRLHAPGTVRLVVSIAVAPGDEVWEGRVV